MSDCAEATRLAMLKMKSGTSYNIGGPEEVSMTCLFNKAKKVMEELGVTYKEEPIYDIERTGDPERRVLDIGRAKEQLGYSPKISLDEGLKRTAEWILKQRL